MPTVSHDSNSIVSALIIDLIVSIDTLLSASVTWHEQCVIVLKMSQEKLFRLFKYSKCVLRHPKVPRECHESATRE